MDQSGYLEAAALRFTEFGGFTPLEGEELPALVGQWSEVVLQRVEKGLVTTVAFLPVRCGSLLPGVQAEMAAYLAQVAQQEGTEALGLLLIVSDQPITRAEYDRVQALVSQSGRTRLVPWVVDLARMRLFMHQGPPFGIDPDLLMLADPSPERQVAAQAAPQPVRSGRLPPLTVGLIGLISLIWLAMTVLGGSLTATETTKVLHEWGAATRPNLIMEGEYWRLLTAGFLHIGIVHLLMNGLSLWWVGQLVERLFGPWRMLAIYLVAMVGGSVASFVFGPPIVLSAGASGAIFGLLGALAWYRLVGPKESGIQQMPILILVAVNLFYGLFLMDNVDNWNHIGGLVAGFLTAAATGYLGQAGPGWRRLAVNGLATLAVVVVAAMPVLGIVSLPGPSQRLVAALDAYEQGEMAEAEAGFRDAVRHQPGEPNLHMALAWSCYYQEKYTDARLAAEAALRLDPTDADARALLDELKEK